MKLLKKGVLIEIIIPSGEINKYIKGIFSIFVVAVLLSPLVNFLNKTNNFSFEFQEQQIDQKLLNYIYSSKAKSLETLLETILFEQGFENVDIVLEFSIENDTLKYNSCKINLKNMVILPDKQHINKYEFIKEVVKENIDISEERIIINE